MFLCFLRSHLSNGARRGDSLTLHIEPVNARGRVILRYDANRDDGDTGLNEYLCILNISGAVDLSPHPDTQVLRSREECSRHD